jgi:hypothetical protein
MGSGDIAPFNTRWSWVVSFTIRPLYPQGKSHRYPLGRGLGGPQSRSGRRWIQKILPLPRIEPRLIHNTNKHKNKARIAVSGHRFETVTSLWQDRNLPCIRLHNPEAHKVPSAAIRRGIACSVCQSKGHYSSLLWNVNVMQDRSSPL